MATDAENRAWLVDQFNYIFGRNPTVEELDHQAATLRTRDRSWWLWHHEAVGTEDAVDRIYTEMLGRPPSANERLWYSTMLKNRDITRAKLREALAGSSEALLREPDTTPDPTQENARDYLASVLKSYGLDGLGDWAWQQIQQGFTNERIIQNLRETDQYKSRFAGLTARREAGLPAISEAEYIAYETSARQMMRAAGLPPDFYDQPDDFAAFIGSDVSISELNARISEGYAAAAAAPPEARAELKRLYGVDEGQLAAFFLEPDRALPVIQRQWTASQISSVAASTTYGALDQGEAERLAQLGVTSDQARQGFGQLAQSAELFGPMVGTDEEEIGRDEQQSAMFSNDAAAIAKIERRVGARKSAASGAQSFTLGQDGVSALGR